MRILIALLLAAFVAQGPALAAKPSAADQEVVLKKKKLAAAKAKKLKEAKEAAEAKKLKSAQDAKKLKAKKLKEAQAENKLKAKKAAIAEAKKKRLAVKEKAAKQKTRTASAATSCTGFFRCVFGESRRPARVSGFGRNKEGISSATTREMVDWDEGRYKPGSIVVRTPERALYFVLSDGRAMRYKVGVGREGFQWSGNNRISGKQEWPDWRPPPEMIEREAAKGHILPEVMEGGPGNPLGARAMYIGSSLYRIHGTNNAASIGGAVSSGCIRMMNADVIDLYERVSVGARVYVTQ